MIDWAAVAALAADGGYAVTVTLNDLEAAVVLALLSNANASFDVSEADKDAYDATIAGIIEKLTV